ncbi:predicted protein [Naegleria gruberi]|uniref:Predicted protein n=1 Tax=Naegleria gruberi TaxID=5762 RepID=D2W5Q1_NAEGR|nr:uncharacterized protein NAEGRDRAFT_76743 [Naegleria gruberi]EFC35602.1 predicted protein [Naegleria gruberi]|eukprot:XP_002668346.1 predicted protein [Naegleria gruberi strain NEG-M]
MSPHHLLILLLLIFLLVGIQIQHTNQQEIKFIRKSSLIHQEISSDQWKQSSIDDDQAYLMEEIDWTLSDHYFTHCWNTTRLMRDDLYYDRMFTMGEEIPSSFGCTSIRLPTVYEYYPYNRKSIYNSELRNIGLEDEALCSRVADWERNLNVSCQTLLCEMDGKSEGYSDLNAMIRQRTDSKTRIEDWVNYCQYCKVDNLRKYREEKKCNPKDETANFLIRKFPNSAFFCGFHQFGIPFIINTSRIVDLSVPLEHTDFSFICYCRESQAFHFKCPDVTTEFELKTEYFAFLLTIFNSVSIISTLVLPKGFSMIKDRKIN